MSLYNYILFENCVARIFEMAGYSVQQNVMTNSKSTENDFIAVKNANKYCIEVKYSFISNRAVDKITQIALDNEMIPVIVVAESVKKGIRDYFYNKYPGLIIIDITNLLFAVQSYDDLRNELIACLNYSTENIQPVKGFIEIDSLQHNSNIKALAETIKLCKKGKAMSRKYEIICRKILENLFSEDLTLWKEQRKSNKELYRFDLLCRIKDGNKKTFWSIIEKYFNSKYVVFEFKNYSEPVTQKEIYTTERYLYAKALRSVGIVVSQSGYDENATWAAKGCLRENGKLLVLLTTEDLIEMSNIKENQEDPAEFLLEKLDNILMELEK